MSDFGILGYSASGMLAEHAAMDVAARNVAIAQTADRNHPVHPLAPVFQRIASEFGAGDDDPEFVFGRADEGDPALQPDDGLEDDPPSPADFDPSSLPGAIRVSGVKARGVAETGLDAVTEMVNVLDAQRAYEYNASVFDSGKRLINKTLDVGNAI